LTAFDKVISPALSNLIIVHCEIFITDEGQYQYETIKYEKADFQSQGITVKIPISEVTKAPNDKKSGDGVAPRDVRKLTVNCIECKTEINTTMEAYQAIVAKLKLPVAQFR
jgi:hypothetical protein